MSLTCPRCDAWCPVDASFCGECGCALTLDAVRAPDLPTPPKASILDRGERDRAYRVAGEVQGAE